MVPHDGGHGRRVLAGSAGHGDRPDGDAGKRGKHLPWFRVVAGIAGAVGEAGKDLAAAWTARCVAQGHPERQAGFAIDALSSPLNPEAFKFIDPKSASYMPTSPANYPKAFEQDIQNFGGDVEQVTQRFEEWVTA